ncbi:hypothetical protein [Agriterribacter sp.]|mgnify:CR=1 FL=1|uniref:DoxX family protein n=1 Tax=Agriterribacter sp. TaxID=2821509 RepID=UPI002BDB88C3|nr:hypothetical protein [Agriterribacter sp.]HRP56184.1 hypothetical protein [Agriterribacter sp.]
MEIEITLLTVSVLSFFIIKLVRKEYKFALSARIGMSVMLVLTAIGHFMFTKGMTMMMPAFIPFKTELVYFTGFIEIAAAIGLQLPKFKVLTGWLLIVFFMLILPVNIYAAIHHVNMETATFNGEGLHYLWYRVPLQLFFIGWIYLSSIAAKEAKPVHF